MDKFGQVWTSLDSFGQFWANRGTDTVNYDNKGCHLYIYGIMYKFKFGQVWTVLDTFGQVWTCIDMLGQVLDSFNIRILKATGFVSSGNSILSKN